MGKFPAMKRTALFALPALMAAALALPSTGSGHAAARDVPPRTDKSCGNPVGLPVSETFTPQRTITMYSPAFHSPDTRTLNVDLAGELDDPSGSPALGSVGVQVFQCCDVRDSEIMPQVIGSIGPAEQPCAQVGFDVARQQVHDPHQVQQRVRLLPPAPRRRQHRRRAPVLLGHLRSFPGDAKYHPRPTRHLLHRGIRGPPHRPR
ncbi:hypothetical protein GCM10020000_33960 [Streptomyces olivoverticillatus]